MKAKIIHIILPILIIVFTTNVVAQNHFLGINDGFGEFKDKGTYMNFDYDFRRVGLEYRMRYPEENSELYVEESFENIKYNVLKLQYLKTNLGFNFNFGKRLYFLIGGGVNYKYLIKEEGFQNNVVFNNHSLGARFNSGIGYYLTSLNLVFSVSYICDYNVTNILVNKDIFSKGIKMSENIKGSSIFLNLSLIYLIKQKK